MRGLSQNIKTMRIKPDGSGYTVAAGVTNVTSDIIDTAGYTGVRIITGWGAIVSGAVVTQKVQQGQASNMSDAADLAGTSETIADTYDNGVSITEIIEPQERYLQVVSARATQNATIDFMLVELFGAKVLKPITQDASIKVQEVWPAPAEGTA